MQASQVFASLAPSLDTLNDYSGFQVGIEKGLCLSSALNALNFRRARVKMLDFGSRLPPSLETLYL
jgi:hypothetical protein